MLPQCSRGCLKNVRYLENAKIPVMSKSIIHSSAVGLLEWLWDLPPAHLCKSFEKGTSPLRPRGFGAWLLSARPGQGFPFPGGSCLAHGNWGRSCGIAEGPSRDYGKCIGKASNGVKNFWREIFESIRIVQYRLLFGCLRFSFRRGHSTLRCPYHTAKALIFINATLWIAKTTII